MATTTQYNPNAELNAQLIAARVSKTVYALVSPEIEAVKAKMLGNDGDALRASYLEEYRDAWTAKQDNYHREFFDKWHEWSSPVVDLDREMFPFTYPTAGASEPLRHIIFDYAARARVEGFTPRIHVFEGEYEGYKAMAEAARIEVVEHSRESYAVAIEAAQNLPETEMFFLSQPSAIDGNVWEAFNTFLAVIKGPARVVVDLTYVGAVPAEKVTAKFFVNQPCVRNVVFSLSKPFGAYYDRIGGVFAREEDLGLFGNKWFKNLFALRLGKGLMGAHDVFFMPNQYRGLQTHCAAVASEKLGIELEPSDVYVLATAFAIKDTPMSNYLMRAGKMRLCLTPDMADAIGTSGKL